MENWRHRYSYCFDVYTYAKQSIQKGKKKKKEKIERERKKDALAYTIYDESVLSAFFGIDLYACFRIDIFSHHLTNRWTRNFNRIPIPLYV